MTETIEQQIKGIGEARCLDELNTYYCASLVGLLYMHKQGMIAELTEDDIISRVNHIANYNIVRVANIAYDKLIASSEDERGQYIVEIARCRDSLKEHKGMGIEQELLDDLCARLNIIS